MHRMAYEKIATCCYCGAVSTLRLGARKRRRGRDAAPEETARELKCGNCGAPLRRIKPIPMRDRPVHVDPPRSPKRRPPDRGRAPLRRRPRLSLGRFAERAEDFFEDVFDVLEDVFD